MSDQKFLKSKDTQFSMKQEKVQKKGNKVKFGVLLAKMIKVMKQ